MDLGFIHYSRALVFELSLDYGAVLSPIQDHMCMWNLSYCYAKSLCLYKSLRFKLFNGLIPLVSCISKTEFPLR